MNGYPMFSSLFSGLVASNPYLWPEIVQRVLSELDNPGKPRRKKMNLCLSKVCNVTRKPIRSHLVVLEQVVSKKFKRHIFQEIITRISCLRFVDSELYKRWIKDGDQEVKT